MNLNVDNYFTVRSIERAAEHEAKRTEQMAKGMLERQKLTNEKVSAPSNDFN